MSYLCQLKTKRYINTYVQQFNRKIRQGFSRTEGYGKITEVNVAETLKEVRRALLDADVNFKIAKDFTTRVRKKR